ncbi:MAG: transposase [Planctomycetaceae bacterium]
MPEPKLHITKRNLPHWTIDEGTYFVSFRLRAGSLTELERRTVLDHIRTGHEKHYLLAAAVVMPDHVHLLLRTLPGIELPRIMKGIKGVSARLINQSRKTRGEIWQDESWDRVVRDAADFDEKLRYMVDNPIKAGLVDDTTRYCAWHCNGELC